jgi:hypothetical protein
MSKNVWEKISEQLCKLDPIFNTNVSDHFCQVSVIQLNTWILMFLSLHSYLPPAEPCPCLRYRSSQINTTDFPRCLKSQFFLLFGNIIPLYLFNQCWFNDSLNNTTLYNSYIHLSITFTKTCFSCIIWRINTLTMIKLIQQDYVIHIYIG